MVIRERAAGSFAARTTCPTTRRGFLLVAAAFGVCVVPPLARAGAATPRVAAIDWAMLETALALGVTPVAATELVLFRKAAVEPAVPDEVADLGLRGSVSYERLLAARPDLILISPWYEARRSALSRIAPVESYSIYDTGRPPYDAAVAATERLGARLGRAVEAARAIGEADGAIASARSALARLQGRQVLVMNLGDTRRFRAFGADSMFGDVLSRVGLPPAWAEPTRFGAYPTVGVEALAKTPEAIVVNVGPTPPSALVGMHESPLWRAMPPIAKGRFVSIAPVNPYGALPAAARFARILAESLSAVRDA
ncbi:iron-siderophore ABC transporter substrate-binding protein [Chelatococcus sambhunathii]|uniref:Iron-siderophore ABC transporter substrate-binding protein n=1 Tax=Chelatococcus sambhunathii TaxID=363953 RepID=A0ABU1DDK6_9HYPH|nr:iron-siderophore ABC transporter substrate-binding protein [Chelatococcus sambhunathii]